MRFDVAVGGLDVFYTEALVRYLLLSNQNNLIIMSVYDPDQLMALMAERPSLCALVTEELFQRLDQGFVEASRVRLLVLTQAITEVNLRQVQNVFMYQKTCEIERRFLRFLIERCQGEPNSRGVGRCKVIGCFSPSGGAGTTTVALATALTKAEKGNKTLFLSMDNYPGYDRLLERQLDHSVTDYIAYIKSRNNWLLGLEAMVSVDAPTGLRFLMPMLYQLDRKEMTPSDWVAWLDYVCNRSDYDYVVIDLNAGDFSESMALLKACDERVYLIVGDETGTVKWDRFIVQVKALEEEAILDRSVRLTSDLMTRSGRTFAVSDAVFPYDPGIMVERGNDRGRINLRSRSVTKLKEVMAHVKGRQGEV